MKIIFSFLGVLAVILVFLCVQNEIYHPNFTTDPKTLTEDSVLIVYAAVKPDVENKPFIIQEIWKDKWGTNSSLVGQRIIGSKIPSNQIPEGEVVFFNSLDKFAPRTYIFVNNNNVVIRINGQMRKMALKQFKIECELHKGVTY